MFDIKSIRTDIPVDLETARKNVLKIICSINRPLFTIDDIYDSMWKFLDGKYYNNPFIGMYVDEECFHLKILRWLIDNEYIIQDKCWFTRNDIKIKKWLNEVDIKLSAN